MPIDQSQAADSQDRTRASAAEEGLRSASIQPIWMCQKIELVPIASLTPNPRNARRHSEKQIAKLALAIEANGFVHPVIVDEARIVLAGNGRLEAARRIGLTEVPCIRIDHLSAQEKRAFAIADNRLAEDSEWDLELLASEIKEIMTDDPDLTIELTGFETPEIDRILETEAANRASRVEELPAIEANKPAASRLGDLWILGKHRLLCGDATRAEAYASLLGDERAQMVAADPPYNLCIADLVNKGKVQHPEFPIASGEMSSEEFREFLRAVMTLVKQFSEPGAIAFCCMDWRHALELLQATQGLYELKNRCVWVKDNAGLGSWYRSKHEDIYVFKTGPGPEINNFGMGHKRYRTNVWHYPGVNIRRPGGFSDIQLHPTAKPCAMVADMIRDCSKRNGIILDPFSGSGTTLIAAERTKRVARVMELSPGYVDLAVRRWEHYTGEMGRHGESGLSLDELAKQRGVVMPHFSFAPK